MKKGLVLENIHIGVGEKEVIKGISLEIGPGKVHALMGPNGSGKSTLANTLMGHPKYALLKGKILLNGKNITKSEPHEKARAGLFLSLQYPPEIGGVTVHNFLRTAWQAIHKKKISAMDFYHLVQKKLQMLHLDENFLQRELHLGFSGGEKKKLEILQMLVLEPKSAILDETDSGLDVDALKTIGKALKYLSKTKKVGILIITHYNRFLHHITPDKVHVLARGIIVKSGNKSLAKEIEKKGFGHLRYRRGGRNSSSVKK